MTDTPLDRDLKTLAKRQAAANKGVVKRDITRKLRGLRVCMKELEARVSMMDSNVPICFERLAEAGREVCTRAAQIGREAEAWLKAHKEIHGE